MFGIFLWFFQPLFCKLLGKNAEVNFELNGSLGLVNGRPYDGGWIEKNMNNAANMESLLDVDQYVTFCEKEGL